LRNLNICILALQVEIVKQTVVNWASFYREVIYTAFIRNKQKLGDSRIEVEIDKSKFERRRFYKSHQVEGQCVFGMFEQGTGHIVMIPVEKRFICFDDR